MIVCLCHAVSQAAIEHLAGQGHDSVCAIGRECGAGTDCGSCRGQIEDILETASERDEAGGSCRRLRMLSSRGATSSSAPPLSGASGLR